MHRSPSAVPAAERFDDFSLVQHVVGPLADAGAPLALYAHGATRGGRTPGPTGCRAALVVLPGTTADLGSWFNAFPAGQWRVHTGADVVRLRIVVDAPAVLTVLRSDRDGAAAVVEQRLLRAAVPDAVDVGLGDDVGLVWFRLQAGVAAVRITDAGWEVRVASRPGAVVVGTPTTGRAADVAENVRRILAAPALAAAVARVVVIDHAADPIAPALRERLGADGDPGGRVVVRRQANLGGSGGYSRVLHEAVGTLGAEFAVLLDDDVVVEPASVLRAVEFARRTRGPAIVGLQMLDADRPTVLEAGAERITDRTFWWSATDPDLPGLDVAARPVEHVPALHRLHEADFAGWWGTVIPLRVARTIGYAMPFFLKWDDAEYGLRARAAGFPTVSLQGAAVWHETWRTKDDARTWPAFFHTRNRLAAALLHGSPSVRAGVLVSGLMVEVKQLLALQRFAVERRQEGVRAVLAGPHLLEAAIDAEYLRLRALSSAAPDQQRVPNLLVEGVAAPAAARALAPEAAPRGPRLAVWTGLLLVRHLVAPVRGADATRLPPGRGTWWVLPSFDDVFTPTADGEAYYRLQRDRRAFRRLLGASLLLHLTLWVRWPALRRRYRAAAAALASPAAWERRFDGARVEGSAGVHAVRHPRFTEASPARRRTGGPAGPLPGRVDA